MNRRDMIDAMLKLYKEKLEAGLEELDDDRVTMERIEEVAEQVEREMGRELTRRLLEEQQEAPGNRAVCPTCQRPARFHSWVRRVLIAGHGEIPWGRRWYRCACGHGFAPLDQRLGLDSGATTPKLRRLVVEWAAERPFEQVARDLRKSKGLDLGESTIERAAVACGQRLRALAAEEGANYDAGKLPEVVHHPRTIYLSMDGVYAPLRDAWKKDGTAGALVCRGGECKVGMAYEMTTDRQGNPQVAWREYAATFADIDAFRPQMGALAHRCGAFAAARQVFLADTLACNWNLAADYFPEAIQIVDFRHAQEHYQEVADAFFGPGSAAGKAWSAARKTELWEGEARKVAAAIQELPVLPGETEAQAEIRRREAAYFEIHRERMRYPSFREQGLQIGSGMIEASCRTVVNQRLDHSGMHWRQETADSVVALRASMLSTTKPDFRRWGTAA